MSVVCKIAKIFYSFNEKRWTVCMSFLLLFGKKTLGICSFYFLRIFHFCIAVGHDAWGVEECIFLKLPSLIRCGQSPLKKNVSSKWVRALSNMDFEFNLPIPLGQENETLRILTLQAESSCQSNWPPFFNLQ